MYLLVRLLRRDAVQQAAKVKIYTEQLQQQKLTLDSTGCMINQRGQGALDSKSRRENRAEGDVPVWDRTGTSLKKKIKRLQCFNLKEYYYNYWLSLY